MMDHVSGVLQWRETGPVGRTSQEDEAGVALYLAEQLKCTDLCLGVDDEPTESL